MKRNINRNGRLMRATLGLVSLLAAGYFASDHVWLAVVFVALGLFTLFEASRGWCAFRACGIKTPF